MSSTPAAPVVFVDALNVIRSRWPNMDEERFVDLTRAWAEREGVQPRIVFDGHAPRSRAGADLVGTGRESADDWIVREAERLAGEGRRLWLVSSDRGLRQRMAPYVERVIGGGTFATELESLAQNGAI